MSLPYDIERLRAVTADNEAKARSLLGLCHAMDSYRCEFCLMCDHSGHAGLLERSHSASRHARVFRDALRDSEDLLAGRYQGGSRVPYWVHYQERIDEGGSDWLASYERRFVEHPALREDAQRLIADQNKLRAEAGLPPMYDLLRYEEILTLLVRSLSSEERPIFKRNLSVYVDAVRGDTMGVSGLFPSREAHIEWAKNNVCSKISSILDPDRLNLELLYDVSVWC